ncbi:single-stranded DNA-binding protein [Corynebacterium hindlerae]|uniref:Single-stranded DNA-binding protein n=1 Tax=Corynebacterium hindlerae TaxID=699041 RepID=A0A7G5FIA8_9CORY|nr:single-stranded DNA-binding protein [Corynebacterium hindlerae]QMV86349.1 single-stranded DNA-binding protein [Corynebacterium hindlerae]
MAYTTIVGTVGKDPELKFTNNGKAYTRVGIAWSERVKDRNGNWDDGPTVWVSATVFGKQAENLADSITKGMRVAATGHLKPETWASQQGEQTVFTMVADTIAPELTFHTAALTKPAAQQQPQQDVRNSAPPAGGNATDDQPPF